MSNTHSNQLAIAGGEPVFPLGPPDWPRTTPEVREQILRALDQNLWGKYESELTDELSAKLTEIFRTPFVTLCSSGTIAVELALRGVGVKPGDEVILAAYDFPGNFRAIEAIGARPVLVDVVENGWTLDHCGLADAVSDLTTAVLVSHLHGQIADLASIRAALENATSSHRNRIPIVEDNCQSPGGRLGDQPLGSFGDAATLSFGGSKLLSAGRGGAVLTQDETTLQRIRIYNERGNQAFPLSQLQAAVLLPQLATLLKQTDRRNANVIQLLSETASIPDIQGLNPSSVDGVPGYYKLPWRLGDDLPCTRDDLVAAFQAEGIAMGTGFRGFHKRTERRCRTIGTLEHARQAAEKTIILHHPVLLESSEVIKDLGDGIKKVIDGTIRLKG